ncbi:MAG: LPS export ABC transporter periplasmic protein LptC [Pseudomonadota bacterium]
MLSIRSLFTVLLAILLLGSVLLVFMERKNHATNPLSNVAEEFMIGTQVKSFDKQGNLKGTISSPQIQHYNANNKMLATTPHITSPAKSGPDWQITAQHGETLKGNQITRLWGDVKIFQPPGKNSNNIKLLTSELTYYSQQNIAKTDQPVTIIQPGTVIHGIGMIANMNTNVIQLLKQTSEKHDPTVKSTNANENETATRH